MPNWKFSSLLSLQSRQETNKQQVAYALFQITFIDTDSDYNFVRFYKFNDMKLQ